MTTADTTHAALDELRWLTARLRLDQDSGASETDLADEAAAVLACITDEQGTYSDGSPLWTIYLLDGVETNRHLNSPPNRRK